LWQIRHKGLCLLGKTGQWFYPHGNSVFLGL
jgi:hypothetical protein